MSANQESSVDETVETSSKDLSDTAPEDVENLVEANDEDNINAAKAANGNTQSTSDALEDDIDASATEAEIAALKNEAKKNMEGWQRTLAEFQNYKRRVEREQKELRDRVALETIGNMLPIIDDFERALASIPEDFAENPWMNGVKLIKDKFNKLLDEHNVVAVDPVGQPFDPNHHQAVSRDDSDEYDSDHVIETLQKGYLSGDTLLRPAIVRIAN